MHRGITLSPTDGADITGLADRTATNPTVAAYARQMRDGDWRDGSLLRFGYIEGEIRLGDGSLALIRTRGHILKGGYDVHHGSDSQAASSAATVHR